MFGLFFRNQSDDSDPNESINEKDEKDQNVGLLDMPDLVMREILLNCDLISISKKPPLPLSSHNEIITRLMDFIEAFLKSRDRPLRLKNVSIDLEVPYPNILNLIDAESLNSLILSGSPKNPEFDVRKFKNLETLHLSSCVSNPIRDFFHIKDVVLTVKNISNEEILEIKEQFMNSSSIIESIYIFTKSNRLLFNQVCDIFGFRFVKNGDSTFWRSPIHVQKTFVCETRSYTIRFQRTENLKIYGF
uniref:FTH domain-containing protein n=1 Tax=Caenorhabditis tropicalis TaxID=1561998 RepID=A0A1I7UTG7_9PELO